MDVGCTLDLGSIIGLGCGHPTSYSISAVAEHLVLSRKRKRFSSTTRNQFDVRHLCILSNYYKALLKLLQLYLLRTHISTVLVIHEHRHAQVNALSRRK